MAGNTEWQSFWVASAAFGLHGTSTSDASGGVVQSVVGIFPVSPQVGVPVSVVPLLSQGGGKGSIALAKILFVLVVVGSASQVTVGISGPSVFSDVGIPFGGESGDSVVSGDTFVASSEFFAQGVNSILSWS